MTTTRELPSGYQLISSTDMLQARRWHDAFRVMKAKNLQPTILYPARLSFRFDVEMKSFQTS